MHNLDLILTLAAGLIAALVFGYSAQRLGWSPIVGYLLAGVLVGPNTPGFVADRELAGQLAEIGVILLMFGVGLHFHLSDLLAVRRVAIAGALVRSVLAVGIAAGIFHTLGWGLAGGTVFGMAIAVSSTVVLIRILSDAGQLQSSVGRISIGWLVMEDIFSMFALVLLPVVFSKEGWNTSVPAAVGIATLKVAAFVVLTLLAGGRVVPWLLNRLAESRSRELFTLGVLSIALGVAVGATLLFGVSMALGAFLAGMVVGQSEFSARAGSDALPMRDAFAVMFFLSVGMLFDPKLALQSPGLLFGTVAAVVLIKPLLTFGLIVALGYSSKTAIAAALALGQIGEFSFLLATLGRQLDILSNLAMNALVVASVVSIMLSPALYRAAAPIEKWLRGRRTLWRLANSPRAMTGPDVPPPSANPTAVVVGYGPTGQTVCRILRSRGIEPTVIEMNIDTFRRLRAEGQPAVYGDASQAEVLAQAGVATASSLILSASGFTGASETVRLGRELNPHLHVVVRADYLSEIPRLRAAGADEVVTGEGEVAVEITGSILRQLGATPDQLDEERDRLRASLRIS